MLVKIKQNYVQMCQKGPLNNFNVQTKHIFNSNDFKQFTVWNVFSRRRKLPHEMKKLTCFQRIKFLLSIC